MHHGASFCLTWCSPTTGSEPRGASAPLSGPQPHIAPFQQCGLSPGCQPGVDALWSAIRLFAPRCTTLTDYSHPDDPTLTADSHPDDPTNTADSHPDAQHPPPIPTPMHHAHRRFPPR
jgi:hypothetical protein